MSTTDQHLTRPENTLGDRDPVLALLTEISTNLKELNSTLKNHTTRLARLEDLRLGDKLSSKGRFAKEISGKTIKSLGFIVARIIQYRKGMLR
jgi:hypothetical protein